MRKVAIIGVGITPFRARFVDKTYFELLPPPLLQQISLLIGSYYQFYFEINLIS